MTSKRKIHYSGAICYDTQGATAHVTGPWAVCCSGDRARKIRKQGRDTTDPGAVTCWTCRTIIDKRVHCAVHPETCCTGGESCAR